MRLSIRIGMIAALAAAAVSVTASAEQSVARQWNELLLNAIRNDYARPTVHARNLFHTSIAMYDAWATYDCVAYTYILPEYHSADNVQAAREETLSYAAYRVLSARFAKSPGADETLPALMAKMVELGYDPSFQSTVGNSPAAVGNRIAINVLAFGFNDNANEQGGYVNQYYEPVNEPLLPDFPGNPKISDPNRWQPLALDYFVDQGGQVIVGGYPEFLSPEWGIVTPFALSPDDLTIYNRDDFDYWVYHDPGAPPYIGGVGDLDYKKGFEMVSIWSSHLDPSDGVMMDASPNSIGNAALPTTPEELEDFYNYFDGGDWGEGYTVNPVTGEPYAVQMVPRGDYGRILAEFWADGPDSETPPGHWFVLLNYVSDHELLEKRFGGEGPILDDLEWDVKSYLIMGGGMHDVAVSAWGIKGWYDYIRPISAIRYMCDQGQCSDPKGPSFHPDGINLQAGLIEVVTEETVKTYHSHLAGKGDKNVGKIAIYAWRGPEYIVDPDVDVAGVDWILAENWWPYQRPTFVTPPFAGYVSGHSTFSRAAAWIMTMLTGSEYFPGGLGEFHCPENEYLVFEEGPSMDVTLQWVSYFDASDQCSLSRIWGGIHPTADDIPGRLMGEVMGPDAFIHAETFFDGDGFVPCPMDFDADGVVNAADLAVLLGNWGPCEDCDSDLNDDGTVNASDLALVLGNWGLCCG